MRVEITREAFRQLVSIDAIVKEVTTKELYRMTTYFEYGVRLDQVEYFASCCELYFITDINT